MFKHLEIHVVFLSVDTPYISFWAEIHNLFSGVEISDVYIIYALEIPDIFCVVENSDVFSFFTRTV